jgi:cysteine desulfurase
MKSEYSSNIYLDYAASTPVDPRVLQTMQPYFNQDFGNPSSIHTHGQAAEAAVEESRYKIAEIFNCDADEVIFTSCGSESDNLALRGVAHAARQQRGANHILISPVEHPAVSKTAEQLATLFGFKLQYLPIDEYGRVSPADLSARLRPETALVSVMYANNEIGTINPINEIGTVCRERGIPFHTDAVQAAAHLPIDSQTQPIDLLSLGAHKLYGPKGIGILIARKGIPIFSMQTGGGQEHSVRAGTSNVAYIVGQAKAFELAHHEQAQRKDKLVEMRDHLIKTVLDTIPDSMLTGHSVERLPNHTSFAFNHVDGNQLLMVLDAAGFSCSSGSACKTGNPEPSAVAKAIGLQEDWALGTLRVTLSHLTTDEDIERFLHVLPEAVNKVRALN